MVGSGLPVLHDVPTRDRKKSSSPALSGGKQSHHVQVQMILVMAADLLEDLSQRA